MTLASLGAVRNSADCERRASSAGNDSAGNDRVGRDYTFSTGACRSTSHNTWSPKSICA